MATDEELEFLDEMMIELEEYFLDIQETAEANIKSADFKLMPSKVTGPYRKDYGLAEVLYKKCTKAHEAVVTGDHSKSAIATLQKTWDDLHSAAKVLEAGNAKYTAFIEQGVAEKAAGVAAGILLLVKSQQKRVGDLDKQLTELEKQLKKAEKDVSGAKLQRGLNVAITAIGFFLPPVKGLHVVYLAVGTSATRLTIDALLGPDGPSVVAAAKTAATDYGGVTDKLSSGAGKFISAASGIDTLLSDSKEVGKATKTVAQIKKLLASTLAAYSKLEKEMPKMQADLIRLTAALEKALKAAKDATGKVQEAELKRVDFLKEITVE